MSFEDIGRRPFEYVIIERDTCALNYGVSPCAAELVTTGNEKCFNTISTCQDKTNFSRSSHRDLFCTPDNLSLPADQIGVVADAFYPFLVSVSHGPSTINPAGGDRNRSPLGTRATLTINLVDGGSDDYLQDKHYDERVSGEARADSAGYSPDERGTFFTKYLARNQYLYARNVIWVTGYIDEQGVVSDSISRRFVVSSVGAVTSSGALTIQCKDPLMLTNIKKAKVPEPSRGRLNAGIDNNDTSLQLTDAARYDASGLVRIDDELIRYSAIYGGNLTGLSRGQYGTVAASHSADTSVQLCWEVSSQKPDAIIEDLLTNYTDILKVDATMLNTTQWAQEQSNFGQLTHTYSAVISDPVGVSDMLADIAQQMMFYPYYDERGQDIKLASVIPAPPIAELQNSTRLNDSEHLLADSVSITPRDDRVVTRVYLNSGVRSWVADLKDRENYKTVNVFAALTEEDDNHRRSSDSMTIYGYWMSDTVALLVGGQAAEIYGKTPHEISFSLDAKDRSLEITDFFIMQHRTMLSQFGLPSWIAGQVSSVNESVKGTRWDYSAIGTVAAGVEALQPERPSVWPIYITANTEDFNAMDEFESVYPDYVSQPGDTINIIVRSGVIVSASKFSLYSILVYAFSNYYPDSSLKLIIESGAWVVGRGGVGGKGGYGEVWYPIPPTGYSFWDTNPPGDGGDGFDAIRVSASSIDIENHGVIGGGGGGGGGGRAGIDVSGDYDVLTGGGGGGGAGLLSGPGGARGDGDALDDVHYGQNGAFGTIDNGGAGGLGGRSSILGGTGGAGGDLGQPGQDGAHGYTTDSGPDLDNGPGGSGGQPGKAIRVGNGGSVTYTLKGDIRGAHP